MAEENSLDSYSSKPEPAASEEISNHVKDVFQEFKTGRQPYEEKAEEWWNNFLSKYQPSKTWRTKEGDDGRSRIFIKMTQLKCYTAQAKVMDAMGPNLPFNLEPLKHLDYQLPGANLSKIAEARKKMLVDYLKYNKFMDVLDNVVLSSTIFPCGIMKGPILVRDKQIVVSRRMIGGVPAEMISPGVNPFEVTEQFVDKYIFEEVPWWNYYVDVNAKDPESSIAECHYKRMLKQQFRELYGLPGYHPEAMKRAIEDIARLAESDPTEDDLTYLQLADDYMGKGSIKDRKVPVLEYQGLVSAGALRKFNAKVPSNIKDEEMVEAIISVAGCGDIIRAQYNFFGARQFMSLRWRKIPNSVYGYGPAGLMDDSQAMINSAARMIIDNKALSGNGLVVLNPDKINWGKTKNMKIYPRKTVYTKGTVNSPKEAIDSITFPDVTMGLREMMEMFVRFADEETAIPKYSQGEAQSSFLNKTAAGMSMIMGAANVNLKPVMKNIDDFIIEKAVERLDKVLSVTGVYPPEINVPLKITATGTVSLIARELIVEQMMKLLSLTQNPQDNLLIKRKELIRSVAEKLELGEFVKTDEEVQQIEAMMAQQPPPFEQKGRVDIDKLYPMMSRNEQAQILEKMGIKPDPAYPGGLNVQTAGMEGFNKQPPEPPPPGAPVGMI